MFAGDIQDLAAQCFVFDVDGTLADTESVHYFSYRDLLEKRYGIAFSFDEFKANLGGERDYALGLIAKRYGDMPDPDEFKDARLKLFLELFKKHGVKPFEYVSKFFAGSEKQLALIVSAQERSLVDEMLQAWKLEGCFCEVYTADGARTKRECLIKAHNDHGFQYSRSVLFDDSLGNLRVGRQLGFITVGVQTFANKQITPHDCSLLIDVRSECFRPA